METYYAPTSRLLNNKYVIYPYLAICTIGSIIIFIYLSYMGVADHDEKTMAVIIFGSVFFGGLAGSMAGCLGGLMLVWLCDSSVYCCITTKNVLSEILLQRDPLLVTKQDKPLYSSVNIEMH